MLAALKKQQLDRQEFDLATFSAVSAGISQRLGYGFTISASPNAITATYSRCPMDDGFRSAGLDHDTIREMCARMSTSMFAALKDAFPHLDGSVKVPDAPEAASVECYALAG